MKNKILIIGGDSEQTASLITSLPAADYDFQTADSENIGAETCKSGVFDLIISFAPEIREAIENIAATEKNWQTVPLLLLGIAPENVAPNVELLGIRDIEYFQMPFEPLRLATKIACLIEREKMKKVVRKRDFRFLALIENSTDLITVLAPDGTIYYESPSARQILGRRPQTNLNTNAFDFIHPEDRQRTIAYLKKAVPNPPPEASIEYRYQHQNGAWCLLESVGRLVEDPTKGKVIVINSRDITKRRESERALRESEERFKAQYRNLPLPTYTWRKNEDDFTFIDCNDAAQKVTDGKAQGLFGMKASDVYQHEPSVIENLHRCFDARETISHELFYKYQTTGENRHLQIYYVYVPPDLVMAHTRDVTESREAAKSLRTSEARFQLAARATNDALWDLDMTTGVSWVNDGYFEMFGYDSQHVQPGYDFWTENLHPDDIERVKENLEKFLESDKLYWSDEYRYRRQDGSYADIFDRGYVTRGKDGKARRMIGAMMDVTERKKVENAVRFQAVLLDMVEQAIVAADFDGVIIYWNKFAEKLFGWTTGEVLGRDVIEYTGSKISRRTAEKLMRQIREGRNWTDELILKHRNGTTFPAQIINSPVQDESGSRIGMLSIINDISESRSVKRENLRLNTQIEVQRQRLNTIIANVPGVVWETSLIAGKSSQRTNFVSDYVEKMTGYTVEEWSGEPDFWLKILHPEDRAHAELEIASFIENKGVGVQQYRWMTKDGAVVWVETQMVLINGEDGKPLSLRGISIDVSERKAVEEALQKSEEQLRQSQKLESVGRLAGGIAHDFNNMLTAINGYSDLILRELDDDDSLRKKVLEIKKAGERSSALTHQLLAFSRRQVLQPKLIDLNKIVNEMSQMLYRLIGEDVQLNIALSEHPSCVEADPGQLSQVIMNLVVNARDAMPQGGELTIKTEKVDLKNEPVALFAPSPTGEPFVMLRVIDNGIGIDDKTIKHIFDPFFTTKQSGVGTGLGLSTVYGIVKQSGGYIWVDSELGKGADFRIYLPQAEEKTGGRKEKKRVEQFPHGTETILLVEDEEMVRDLTRRILELCGYTVIEARDGVEALKISEATSGEIELLMTDVVMPQMNGRELSEKMHEIRPQIRTLFTSGYMNDRLMRNGISVEDVDFIQKPFAPDVLARKIRQLLDRTN